MSFSSTNISAYQLSFYFFFFLAKLFILEYIKKNDRVPSVVQTAVIYILVGLAPAAESPKQCTVFTSFNIANNGGHIYIL